MTITVQTESSGVIDPTEIQEHHDFDKNNKLYINDEASNFDVEVEEQAVQDILTELTDTEKEEMPDMTMPIRHFREQKGSVKKAVLTIRATLKWRKEFGVDRIINFKDDTEMYPIIKDRICTGIFYVRGYDTNGRALCCVHPELLRIPYKEDDMVKHFVYVLEKAISCTKRKSKELVGRNYIQFVSVLDYSQFKLADAGPLSLWKKCIDITQLHYQGLIHRIYLINAPTIFRVFWALIKPFLNADLKSRIIFCTGTDGIAKFTETLDTTDILEPGFGGPQDTVRPFDPDEYMNLPFNVAFDE